MLIASRVNANKAVTQQQPEEDVGSEHRVATAHTQYVSSHNRRDSLNRHASVTVLNKTVGD